MKHLFCLLIALCASAIASTQPEIKVYYQSDYHKGYNILADNGSFLNYTVELTFSDLAGYKSSRGERFRITIPPKSVGFEICALRNIENEQHHNFRYSHTTYSGIHIPRPDTTFTYLIPAIAGHEVTAFHVNYFGEVVGKDKPGFYAAGFRYRLGDTICAARAGTVCKVFDHADKRSRGEIYGSQTRNYITVEQPDGTLAHYSMLSPVKLLVEEGDKIIPGQPIAVISAEDFNYPLILTVSHLNLNNLPDEQGSFHSTVHTIFCTEQNPSVALADKQLYKAVHPVEIITKELSKKEIKKLGLKKQ